MSDSLSPSGSPAQGHRLDAQLRQSRMVTPVSADPIAHS